MLRALLCLALLPAACAATIAEKTAGLQKLPGYFPLYWDAKAGRLWLEVGKWNQEFLYTTSLPGGLGDTETGLDRGTPGPSRIVKFVRSGPKVLLLAPNYFYRATSSNAFERQAVEESFAPSVLWGFTVEAEDAGHALIDATPLFLTDAVRAIDALERSPGPRKGKYRIDATRSTILADHTRNFPKNTDVEALVTLVSDGPIVITLRYHHSFVELPEPGYEPRAFDPRAGYFGISYFDFATPLGEPLNQQFLERHRLRKKDPAAPLSEPVKPIVYYLDRGTPEPIRSALLEGARWWNQAFEAAGYKDAFRVELLPEDADPMDIRYNLIQWVHRSTRGWSYGATVADPRTGEIIRGKVTLGSLRSRHDYLIAEALLAPYEAGKPVPAAMEAMVLARMRQLAAHEVGHTLGLGHNFAASTRGRASVMDYPAPLVKLGGGGDIDLSEAYATGIGEWDKVAIAYGYQDFSTGSDRAAALRAILDQAHAKGLFYLTDQDARPAGGAHPLAHLWDNNGDPLDELARLMEVRTRVLARFGERNIREGAPWTTLQEPLVLAYLLHRYQTEAVAKTLGGLDYRYALRGDGQLVASVPAPERQRRALDLLLSTMDDRALTLPESLLRLLPPRAPGFARTQEDFPFHTGLAFDPLGAAEAAANLTIGLMLHPERAARLVEHHARDAAMPSLEAVIAKLIAATWRKAPPLGLAGEVHRAVDFVALYHLAALAHNDAAAPESRAVAAAALAELRTSLAKAADAHSRFGAQLIEQWEKSPEKLKTARPPEPPPGQPIGCEPE